MKAHPRKRYRKIELLDVMTAGLAWLWPFWTEPLDQLRLDCHMILDGILGRKTLPLRDADREPLRFPPLYGIDPIRESLPASLGEHYERLRRDLAVFIGGLMGRRPAPIIERPKWPKPPPKGDIISQTDDATLRAARALRVEHVVRETPDALSLYLQDPTGAEISFIPGQFFTLLMPIGDVWYRRAYSPSSSYLDKSQIRLTVKRMKNGRVSNHVNDHVKSGDTLHVLGPSGSFIVEPDPARSIDVVLIAGGSGITPLMAIADAVLKGESKSFVFLLYGNRRREDIIYRDELVQLAGAYPGRLWISHILSEPGEDWKGGVGILDSEMVTTELDAMPIHNRRTCRYYICGPEPMMEAVRKSLDRKNVSRDRIFEERFAQPHLRPTKVVSAEYQIQTVIYRLGASETPVHVKPGQTILAAGLAARLPMKYSCTMGGCGRCRIKLQDGQVHMEEPNYLTTEERAAGYILACVSRPVEPVTVEIEK